jgi:hypothetical protein
MTPLMRRSKTFARWARLGLAAAFSAIGGPGQATAQVFFSPYTGYAFPQPTVESELGFSPRRIAAILARNGYRLAGPLARRGDQIIAYGVDEHGWRTRIILDPYEGEVLSVKPIGPAFAHGGPFEGPAAAEPFESKGRVYPDGRRRRGGLAPLGPEEPADAAEPAARGRRRAVIPGLGDEARPARQPKALSAPRPLTAVHSTKETGRRAVPNPVLSKAAKSAAVHSATDAEARVVRPAPSRAIAPSPKAATADELARATADAPTAKTATKVAPVQAAATPASVADVPRATKPDASGPPTTPAAQPDSLGPTNEAGTKSNIGR